MTRRLRIDDLPALTIAESARDLAGRARASPTWCAATTSTPTSPSSRIWLTDAAGAARRLTQGTDRHEPRPSRPTARRSRSSATASSGPSRSRGGEPTQRTSLPISAPVRRCGAPTRTRIAFIAPVDVDARRRRDRRRPRAPRRRPDRRRRRRLPGRRHAASSAACGCSSTSLDLASGEVRQLTDADAHVVGAALEPRLDEARLHRDAACVDDLDPRCRRARHRRRRRQGAARGRRVRATASPAPSPSRPTARRSSSSAGRATPCGHAGLFAVDLATGSTPAARGIPRPQRHARRTGVPRRPPAVHRRRRRALRHPRPRLHPPVRRLARRRRAAARARRRRPRRQRPLGRRIVRRDRPRDADLVRRDRPRRPRVRRRDRRSPRTARRPTSTELYVRESREFTISDGVDRAGLDHPRPRGHRRDAAPHRHPRRTAQRVERRGRRHAPVPPGARRARLDRAASSTRAAATATARSSTPPSSARWGKADAQDFLEPIDQLVAEGLVDPKRLALTGYSYGGFMTCYLTGHDERFAAAVAGGVVSDLTSIGGTSDDAHLINDIELGAMPWHAADRERLAEHVALHERRQGHDADARAARRGRRALPRRPGRAVALRAARARRPDPHGALPRRAATSSRSSASRATASTTARASSSGSSATPATPPARVPSPIDVAHWERRLAALAKRHKVPGAQLGILRLGAGRDDELVTASHRHAQQEHQDRRPGDGGLDLPDRLDLEGVDRHGHHAARRRGQDHPRHPGRRRPPRAAAHQRRADRRHHDPAPAHPHQRPRRRRLHRHRSRRRLPRDVRRRRSWTPAQNHPIGATWSYCNSGFSVLGRVIEVRHRQDVGRRDARPAVHAARAHAHRDAARGGDPLRRRRRPRRHRRRADRHARVGPSALARPGRPHHGPRRRPARVRPPAHGRRRRRRRHAPAQRGDRRSTCRRSRPTCPTRTRSATRGASAGSASTGTASGSTATTATRIGQAAFLRIHPERGRRGHAAHQRRQHPRLLRGPLPRDLRRAGGCRDEAPARSCRPSRPTSTSRRTSASTSARRCAWRSSSDDDGPAPAHRGARSARRARAGPGRRVPAASPSSEDRYLLRPRAPRRGCR